MKVKRFRFGSMSEKMPDSKLKNYWGGYGPYELCVKGVECIIVLYGPNLGHCYFPTIDLSGNEIAAVFVKKSYLAPQIIKYFNL